MKVREHINFERGIDPKKAMGLGFFKYEVEYGERGFEEVKESDEQLARRWVYDDQRILDVQGSVGSDHISMWILLSDKKEFSVEANLFRESKFAYLTIPSEDIKDQDVTEEFFKFLQEEFSALQPVLSVYESYFDEKKAEEEWRRQIEEEEAEEESELQESVNFERGMDPMRSMDIGMFHFDVEFSGDIENMEEDEKRMAKKWNYKGIRILSVEGEANEDSSELFFKLSDGDEIRFKQKSYMGPFRPTRPDYAKISIKSLGEKEFEVYDAWMDELSNGSIILATMRMYEEMYEDIKREALKESQNFERGIGPKDAMGIGNELYRHNLEVLRQVLVAFPWIEDNPEIYASRLTDLGTKLISVDQKTSNFFVFHWINSRGGMQLRTVNLPKEKWVNLFAAVVGMIRQCETVKEAQGFQRGMDPKASMRIGLVSKRVFDSDEEIIKWILQFPKIVTEGTLDKWDPENMKGTYSEEYRKNFWNFKEEKDFSKLRMVKWIKSNIFMRTKYGEYDLGLKECKQIADIVCERIYKNKINEAQEFQRGIDPKASMKIGMPTWETLKEGDLIFVPKKVGLKKDYSIISRDTYNISEKDAVADLPEGTIMFVHELDSLSTKEWTLWYAFFSSLKDYQSNKDEINFSDRKGYINGTPKQFKTKFKLLPRNMSESQEFQRGVEPKSTMGIGKKAMIEKWLEEYHLQDICSINEDLTIDSSAPVGLGGLEMENFPEFIQFNIVRGGFNIENNKFTSLRGCPKKVLETETWKGNFKCQFNKLTSLEFSPKSIDGNYLCSGNPGKFTRSDVKKVCKVKSGKIWVDSVNESMEFQRTGKPLDTMNLGYEAQIKNWLRDCGITNDKIENFVDYRINKDGTIDVLEDINLVGAHIEDFPYFIKFNKIYGSFYVANNKFTNLKGFPKEVDGDLSIYSEVLGAKKWKEFEIRKVVKVKGTVWN